MAYEAFLKMAGVPGDAVNKAHKGEIEVLSYSWGITNAASATPGGGGGVGKPSLSDFSILKQVDKASPLLFAGVCTGRSFPEAIFTVEMMGGTAGAKPMGAMIKITFSDVLISSFQMAGSSELPTESVSLGFGSMEIEVRDETGNMTKAESCGGSTV